MRSADRAARPRAERSEADRIVAASALPASSLSSSSSSLDESYRFAARDVRGEGAPARSSEPTRPTSKKQLVPP